MHDWGKHGALAMNDTPIWGQMFLMALILGIVFLLGYGVRGAGTGLVIDILLLGNWTARKFPFRVGTQLIQ